MIDEDASSPEDICRTVVEKHREEFLKCGIDGGALVNVLDYRVDHTSLLPVLSRIVTGDLAVWREVRGRLPEHVWEGLLASRSNGRMIQVKREREAAKRVVDAWKKLISPFHRAALKMKGTVPHVEEE